MHLTAGEPDELGVADWEEEPWPTAESRDKNQVLKLLPSPKKREDAGSRTASPHCIHVLPVTGAVLLFGGGAGSLFTPENGRVLEERSISKNS